MKLTQIALILDIKFVKYHVYFTLKFRQKTNHVNRAL